jgi:hypothetical protein
VTQSMHILRKDVQHLRTELSLYNLSCRYPFELASCTIIRTTVADTSCNSSGPTHPGIETLATHSPVGGPDPTIEITLHLGGAVCPGTRLHSPLITQRKTFASSSTSPLSLDRYLVR